MPRRCFNEEKKFAALLTKIQGCNACTSYLPQAPNPVLRASLYSPILIIGQAPGTHAHSSSLPWNDKSGERLRIWTGLSSDLFYDTAVTSLVPMGFCYPGKGKSGDLPPRAECAPMWHAQLFELMHVKLTLLVGQYAQNYYLNDRRTLTQRVQNYRDYLPKVFVLPHPSPRNNIWLKRNDWFEKGVIPCLQRQVKQVLRSYDVPPLRKRTKSSNGIGLAKR